MNLLEYRRKKAEALEKERRKRERHAPLEQQYEDVHKDYIDSITDFSEKVVKQMRELGLKQARDDE